MVDITPFSASLPTKTFADCSCPTFTSSEPGPRNLHSSVVPSGMQCFHFHGKINYEGRDRLTNILSHCPNLVDLRLTGSQLLSERDKMDSSLHLQFFKLKNLQRLHVTDWHNRDWPKTSEGFMWKDGMLLQELVYRQHRYFAYHPHLKDGDLTTKTCKHHPLASSHHHDRSASYVSRQNSSTPSVSSSPDPSSSHPSDSTNTSTTPSSSFSGLPSPSPNGIIPAFPSNSSTRAQGRLTFLLCSVLSKNWNDFATSLSKKHYFLHFFLGWRVPLASY
ncbi:hypothetical protein K457DRAFT_12423 [Linnemannia elongata AG-77]|uniref:Uncharacterized protein n=1 Tax=Linnemannia elongata AG-77 TaxID=1314771 RepID=A0A197KKL3_9FUNG|nr:hypothetical protein K457DRAFT_12423 [Linnemannia elongata AG-77]